MHKINYGDYKVPTDYIKFPAGKTAIRIISDGFLGLQHGLKTANRWVNLGLCTEDEQCEHCAKGNVPKKFWKWVVVERSTGEVFLLDAGPMIGNQICLLAAGDPVTGKPGLGDPQKYDLVVSRSGAGRQTQYVVSKAAENQEFTEKDVARWKTKKKILITKYMIGQ